MTEKLPYVVVLAGNTREGRTYAVRARLPKGRHRVVHSAKQIRRLRHADIHELPSFSRRPDRHAINAALKFTRGERRKVTMPPKLKARPELTERLLTAAYRYHYLRELEIATAEVAASEDSYPDTLVVDVDEARELAYDERLEREHLEDFQRGVGARPATRDEFMSAARDLASRDPELDELKQVAEVRSNVESTLAETPEQIARAEGRQRRTRCEVCGELVWTADDPAHDDAKHDQPVATVEDAPRPQRVGGAPRPDAARIENFFGRACCPA